MMFIASSTVYTCINPFRPDFIGIVFSTCKFFFFFHFFISGDFFPFDSTVQADLPANLDPLKVTSQKSQNSVPNHNLQQK